MANLGDRFSTGQICTESGIYEFDGYIGASLILEPSGKEKQITVCLEKKFPCIKSADIACWWKLTRKA